MENAELLIQFITELQNEIVNLGNAMNQAEVNWKDEKFNELTNEINQIANSSQEIMQIGEHCKKNIKEFRLILNH